MIPVPINNSSETLAQCFEHFAQTQPEHVAILEADATSSPRCSSARTSYRALNARANVVAHAIATYENSSPVTVLMNSGASLAAAILGTMKTGRVCVPLDSAFPAARLRLVLEDADAQLIVTDNANQESARQLAAGRAAVLNFDELAVDEHCPDLQRTVDARDAAYLIYTSGSTGQPKGVIETHRNVLHHVRRYAEALDFQPADRIALLASCSVGQGMKTFCSALLSGATLCPFDLKTRGVEALATWLETEKITVLICVPSVFRRLAQTMTSSTRYDALRLIRLGGETLHKSDVGSFRRVFSPHCRLANSYSSTETGNVALGFIDQNTSLDDAPLPVGRIAPDVAISIVDESGAEVGTDEIGEILVRSAWLSPGYWRDAEKTRAVFQRDENAQLYRTGDLGSLSRDGVLTHRGRVDSQIKIRGFRVELGEVEAALRTQRAVREAVVVAHRDARGENVLTAFVVGTENDARVWRGFLADKLPPHAIPRAYRVLDKLPLTSNGKIDRAHLKSLAAELFANDGHSPLETQDAPRDEIERRLAQIWAEILGVTRIGRDEDFFALGGDSLATVALQLRIEETFARDVARSDLFGSSVFGVATLAAQADFLRTITTHEPELALPNVVTLQPNGARPPLFCVHDMGDSLLCYRDFVRALGRDQPVYGLRPAAHTSSTRSWEARDVEAMAAAYVRDVCAFQPQGALYLCGYSFGGTIAFEMARQLEQRGRTVAFLALLDTNCRADASHGNHNARPMSRRERQRNHRRIWRRLRGRERVAYFSHYARERMTSLQNRFAPSQKPARRAPLRAAAQRLTTVQERNRDATARYELERYDGNVTLFRAMLSFHAEHAPDLGWKKFAASVSVIEVAGDHFTLLQPPHATMLARRFKRMLRAAHAAKPSR